MQQRTLVPDLWHNHICFSLLHCTFLIFVETFFSCDVIVFTDSHTVLCFGNFVVRVDCIWPLNVDA